MRALTITNARVFDGTRLSEPRSVRIIDGLIDESRAGAAHDEVVDAEGGVLLPGLIDGHVHIDDPGQTLTLARWGVSTALDMGAKDPGLIRECRDQTGRTSLRSAGFPAGPVTGTHIARLGYPAWIAIAEADDAVGWVAQRAAEGSDYIKVLLEPQIPGQPEPLSPTTAAAVVDAAHAGGRRVVMHTTTVDTVRIAVTAGADVFTHSPLAGAPDAELVQQIVDADTVAVPTLSMMKALADHWPFPVRPPEVAFENALAWVGALHRAGVSIVAGTDANADPATPARVPHGESLHDELALMVEAGLTPVDALRAATEVSANRFGLSDRGAIRSGLRADLLLVAADPTVDIAATRDIRGVWIAGERVR
ncbi:amidohydrolase family protein [Nakamurella sp. A5-74]|uniref:Amidohydrolase family protein n=1 Tax=Nakamurella sp. A5-74 TaxID=3158264 RepID=A0AAU8DJ27_9ACTN